MRKSTVRKFVLVAALVTSVVLTPALIAQQLNAAVSARQRAIQALQQELVQARGLLPGDTLTIARMEARQAAITLALVPSVNNAAVVTGNMIVGSSSTGTFGSSSSSNQFVYAVGGVPCMSRTVYQEAGPTVTEQTCGMPGSNKITHVALNFGTDKDAWSASLLDTIANTGDEGRWSAYAMDASCSPSHRREYFVSYDRREVEPPTDTRTAAAE